MPRYLIKVKGKKITSFNIRKGADKKKVITEARKKGITRAKIITAPSFNQALEKAVGKKGKYKKGYFYVS